MSVLRDRLSALLGDRYDIDREIGRGGMAVVFSARDRKLDRTVAIKVMREEIGAAVGSERFLREIRIAAKLHHPHILPVYDSGGAESLLFYVMPFVQGESLRDRLRRERQLPIGEAVQLARQVASGLAAAHSAGIVHRDIKPENVLLHGSHALIADFGVARAVEVAADNQLTATGVAVGTPTYMSPEQAGGDHLDGRSDVYSLGCTLYEMLTGHPPFAGATAQAMLARKLLEPPPSLRSGRDTISDDLEQVVYRALARVPADRFSSALEFSTALEQVSPLHPPAGGRVGGGHRRRHPWRWAAGAVVVLLGAVALWASRPGTTPSPRSLSLAVFPFRPLDPAAAEWSEALSDLLTTTLEGVEEIRIVDPWSLWRALRETPGAMARAPDPLEAGRLALRAGASRYVLASVVLNGGRLQVSVRTYGVGRADPLSTFAASARADSIVALVQNVGIGVIAGVWQDEGQATPAVSPLAGATHSVDALKAYLEARTAMRRGLVAKADIAIDHALSLDSTFALALVEAPVIKSWVQFMTGRAEPALLSLAERAVAHSSPLDPRNRYRARAVLAAIRTEGVRAAEAAQQILALDSLDFDAWSLLAYVHRAHGWRYGATPADAVNAAERVLALDPSYVPGLASRAELAAASDDMDDIRRQSRRLAAADTTQPLVRGTLRGLEALLADDAAFARMAPGLGRSPFEVWHQTFRLVRMARPDRAKRLAETLLLGGSVGTPRDAALAERARLAIAQGHIADIDADIRRGRHRAGDFDRVLDRFIVAAGVANMAPRPALERAVAALTRYVPIDSALSYFETRPVPGTAWVLGAYHAALGDTTQASRWREVFGQFPAGGAQADYRRSLQLDLDARIAERAGHRVQALALAQRAFDLWSVHSDNAFEHHPEVAIRFHLAQLLASSGLPDSAAALFRSLIPPTSWLGFYTPRSAFELAELYARKNRPEAAPLYRLALDYWSEGTEEVASWRERAARGSARK